MSGNALVPAAVSINTESKNHGLSLLAIVHCFTIINAKFFKVQKMHQFNRNYMPIGKQAEVCTIAYFLVVINNLTCVIDYSVFEKY